MPQTCPTRLHSARVWYNPWIHGNANGAKGQEKVNEHRKKQRLRGAMAFYHADGCGQPFFGRGPRGRAEHPWRIPESGGRLRRHHRLCVRCGRAVRLLPAAFFRHFCGQNEKVPDASTEFHTQKSFVPYMVAIVSQISTLGPRNDNPNYIIQVGNVFGFIISIENII